MIFPPEIINDTTESHFAKHTTRSKVIYLTVVITVAIILVSLPFISVEVSTQARGIIRTPFENNQLQTVVSGEITAVFIAENTEVKKGDTLLILNSEHIREQISREEERIIENMSFMEDILFLLAREENNLSTPKYITENNYFNIFSGLLRSSQ